jgi:Mlc titration factor MtfA (ptsG expression regulator)
MNNFYFHALMLLGSILFLIFFLWFVGNDLILILWFDRWQDEDRSIRKIERNPNLHFLNHRNKLEPILAKHLEYYRRLDERSKVKFLFRCRVVMKQKEFVGKENLEITEEIKILLSASMVQLTFGLRDFELPDFDTFIIYPGVYKSPLTGILHRGETSMKGYVVLSWQHFMEGYENSDDKLNLGLHELAHALDLSRIVKSADPDFYEYFLKFQTASGDVFNEVNEQNEHFLRKYAGTDEREFFSVCVEHFFEDPSGFKAHLPKLYQHLSTLLKQDPIMLGKEEHTQLKWKSNFPEMQQLLESDNVKFKSDFPFWHATSGIIVPIAIFSFVVGMDPELDANDVLFPLSFFLIVGMVNFFMRSKQIIVTEEFIFIYSPIVSSWKTTFLIENLITIKYFNKRSTDALKFTYLNAGQVETKVFRLGMDRSEYNRLKESMHNKEVLMTR